MTNRKGLRALMAELGYEEFADPGFDAFRKGDREVRFFWWSSITHSRTLNVPRASLVVRLGAYDTHISLVEWPSTEQHALPWTMVANKVRELLEAS